MPAIEVSRINRLPRFRPCSPPPRLRHSDDQTIAALAAVHEAVRQNTRYQTGEFERWGILAASRFLGRSTLVAALNRFDSEGVWGVSPHLIPHYALHSPAGTLSLALGIRGPSLGIGGGISAGFEGLLAALSWLAAGVVPGLWLVQTEWSPEFVPDHQSEPPAECACYAMAMALVPGDSCQTSRPEIRVVSSRDVKARRMLGIAELVTLLGGKGGDRLAEAGRRSSAGRVHEGHAATEDRRPHFGWITRNRPATHTIACDTSGRTRIEMVLPCPVPAGEDEL